MPAHIETKDHQFYTRVELGDNKTPHQVGLIEWLDGDSLETLVSKASKEIIENSFFKLGELMAQVHNQTSNWTPREVLLGEVGTPMASWARSLFGESFGKPLN